MKKYIILTLTAMAALTACSKVEIAPEAQREINFQVANSVRTKATSGAKYENGAFGTYAWFNAANDFMVNEQVDTVGSVWKTVDHTFYWPKSGSITFISYSPFKGTSDTAGTVPAVTQSSITYTGYEAGTEDIMYADKVTCSSNVNEVADTVGGTADSGYKGVPTVFHHALAKLSFKMKANFVTYVDTTTNSRTSWDVTVTSAKISGFKNTGDCALTLNTDGKTWDKPVTKIGTDTVYVWTNVSGATDVQELIDTVTTYPGGVKFYYDADAGVEHNDALDLSAASGFVMPQLLTAGAQKLELTIHIKTHLSNGKTIDEDFTKVVDIKDISSLKAWEMNQNIVYTIKIKPTAKADGADGHDDDPNDVIITFDPAVADWTTVDASATIQL